MKVAPGWYPCPEQGTQQYWDGQQWSPYLLRTGGPAASWGNQTPSGHAAFAPTSIGQVLAPATTAYSNGAYLTTTFQGMLDRDRELRRLGRLEVISGVVWTLIAVIQVGLPLLSPDLWPFVLIGLWNLVAAATRFSASAAIRSGRSDVPDRYRSWWGLAVIFILNLLFLAVFGALWVFYDVYVRSQIRKYSYLFTREPPGGITSTAQMQQSFPEHGWFPDPQDTNGAGTGPGHAGANTERHDKTGGHRHDGEDQSDDPQARSPAVSAVAGWYPDPQNRDQQRYWDGQAWTTHVHPIVSVPPGGDSQTESDVAHSRAGKAGAPSSEDKQSRGLRYTDVPTGVLGLFGQLVTLILAIVIPPTGFFAWGLLQLTSRLGLPAASLFLAAIALVPLATSAVLLARAIRRGYPRALLIVAVVFGALYSLLIAAGVWPRLANYISG